MKKDFGKIMTFVLVMFFFSVGAVLAENDLSKAVFKVNTQNKEAKVKIETVVNMLKGVAEAELDTKTKRLEVKYDAGQIDESMIQFVIEALGYPATPEPKEKDKSQTENKAR